MSGGVYKCPWCSQCFSQRSGLKDHFREHPDSDEKPFSCHICEKSFTQRKNLLYHLRAHSGEKPYQCDQCSQSFRSKDHVHSHMKTHAESKFFECPVCKKQFTRKDNCLRHVSLHNEPAHLCHVCKRSFRRKDNLQTHMKRHTFLKITKSKEKKQKAQPRLQSKKRDKPLRKEPNPSTDDPSPADVFTQLSARKETPGANLRKHKITREKLHQPQLIKKLRIKKRGTLSERESSPLDDPPGEENFGLLFATKITPKADLSKRGTRKKNSHQTQLVTLSQRESSPLDDPPREEIFGPSSPRKKSPNADLSRQGIAKENLHQQKSIEKWRSKKWESIVSQRDRSGADQCEGLRKVFDDGFPVKRWCSCEKCKKSRRVYGRIGRQIRYDNPRICTLCDVSVESEKQLDIHLLTHLL